MQLMTDETEIVRALEDTEASFFWPVCRVGTAFWKSMDSRCVPSMTSKPRSVVTLSARMCASASWGPSDEGRDIITRHLTDKPRD